MTYELNTETAQRVIDAIRPGLVIGKGKPIPGQMCVEAAVCYAMGLPHSDEPTCVGDAIRAFKITLNDSNWSSDQARADGMIRLGVAQLGSDTLDQDDFTRRLAEQTIRQIVPIALRAIGLEAEAVRCELEGSVEAARDAYNAAYAVRNAAYSAANAAHAATNAAYSAANAAFAAAYSAALAARTSSDPDAVLRMSADIALQILVDMKSPGCEYLSLIY